MHNIKRNTEKNDMMLRILKRSLIISLTALIAFYFIGCAKDNSGMKPAQSIEKADGAAAKTKKRFILITCPIQKPTSMFIRYNRLSNYLKKSTGFEIELFKPEDFKEFKKKIVDQEADLLFVEPVVYLELEDSINKNHLYGRLSGFEGELKDRPFETGSIFARVDSGIKTIKDIKGKKMAFGARKSAAKWIAARKLFMDNGIDPEKDLAGYTIGNKCKDIILDVLFKKVDVGCVRTLVCPVSGDSQYYQKRGLDIAQLLFIGRTDPVNTWVFTCTNRVDAKDMEKIAGALIRIPKLDLHEKERLTRDLKCGFVKVDDSEFDGLRKMVDMTPILKRISR